MSGAISTHRLRDIGKPLTAVQLKKFEASMKRVAAQMKADEDRERKAPRLNFIARATRAGFTVTQAEFIWENRYTPEPRLIG